MGKSGDEAREMERGIEVGGGRGGYRSVLCSLFCSRAFARVLVIGI